MHAPPLVELVHLGHRGGAVSNPGNGLSHTEPAVADKYGAVHLVSQPRKRCTGTAMLQAGKTRLAAPRRHTHTPTQAHERAPRSEGPSATASAQTTACSTLQRRKQGGEQVHAHQRSRWSRCRWGCCRQSQTASRSPGDALGLTACHKPSGWTGSGDWSPSPRSPSRPPSCPGDTSAAAYGLHQHVRQEAPRVATRAKHGAGLQDDAPTTTTHTQNHCPLFASTPHQQHSEKSS